VKRLIQITVVLLLALLAIAARIFWIESHYALLSNSQSSAPVSIAPAQLIERGAYLAKLGNCAGCHTAPGGATMAGTKAIKTPFGQIYTTNLTPDKATGLGLWNQEDFYRAMHVGQSKDGHLLYPAFPYENYSAITRSDSDALWAYLVSLEPVVQPNKPHELRFPYRLQASLAVWRWLYFSPQTFKTEPKQSEQINRGAYLTQTLGHCAQCHSPRNALGAITTPSLSGAVMLGQDWFAPSLLDVSQAAVLPKQGQAMASLLTSGSHIDAVAIGPMASVIYTSLQYWNASDIQAMVAYLDQVRVTPHVATNDLLITPADSTKLARGAKVYELHCANCHADNGKGEPGIIALAGNRAVQLANTNNLVKIVLQGGYSPSTKGNPQPYGMPPFAHQLSDEQIGDVISFIRQSWGNNAASINELKVRSLREAR
jgi:mono/diheme cytochrome c family protein